jgi:hypothetical protein
LYHFLFFPLIFLLLIFLLPYENLRNLDAFFAIFLGCLENCLPALFAFRLADEEAAYSLGERALIAAEGK